MEAYCAALRRGERPDRERLIEKYPSLARDLRECLDGLDLIQRIDPRLVPDDAADSAGSLPRRGVLGDFQILREIGCGGMGVVYEAEQISLGRRVALKVLPFASMLDPRHLQRFQNERARPRRSTIRTSSPSTPWAVTEGFTSTPWNVLKASRWPA